jgi:hypothetical protein
MEKKNDERYIISKSGKRCITKCHLKGTSVIHPYWLSPVSRYDHDFCLVIPYEDIDTTTGKKIMEFQDGCDQEQNKYYTGSSEMERLLMLQIIFIPNDFLKTFYNINSFNDAIEWSKANTHLPFGTIRRVHNCSWKAFGYKSSEVSYDVVQYYHTLVTNNWINDYIIKIEKDISVKINRDKSFKNNEEFIRHYILSNILIISNFESILKKYIETYYDTWIDIESHYLNLKLFIYQEIINKF